MTFVAFPLSPVPATYGTCDWSRGPRGGIFAPGSAVLVPLGKIGATAYYVKNLYGQTVSSGSCSPTATTISPTPPGGGWLLGWYRIYMTGPVNDAVFGTSYMITNFCVMADDPHFIPMPPSGAISGGSNSGESPDVMTKGVLGMGTSRIVIGRADNPTLGSDTLAIALQQAASSVQFWTNPFPYIGPSLVVSPSSVVAGTPLTISWDHVDPTNTTDWISIVHAGDSNSAYLNWVYAGSWTQVIGSAESASGSNTWTATSITPGNYQFFLNSSGGFAVLAESNIVTIT